MDFGNEAFGLARVYCIMKVTIHMNVSSVMNENGKNIRVRRRSCYSEM